MSTSVIAVKGLMKTLGVEMTDLFTAEERLAMAKNFVKNKEAKIVDLYSTEDIASFIEAYLKENKELAKKFCTLDEIRNAIREQKIAMKDLFPEEAANYEKMQSTLGKIVSACGVFSEKKEEAGEDKAKCEQPAAATEENSSAGQDELEFVKDSEGFTYAKQSGRAIGIVINDVCRRFIVMHDYAPDNLSKEEAKSLAAQRKPVNGKFWRLMTDEDCLALCSRPYNDGRKTGGQALQDMKKFMRKLGGDFCHAEHLTQEYQGQLPYKVKFVVDL